jgi:hypothetical protein
MWCDRGGSRNRRKRRYMMNEMKIAGERIAAINPKLMLKTIFALNTEIRRIMTTAPSKPSTSTTFTFRRGAEGTGGCRTNRKSKGFKLSSTTPPTL